MEVSMMENQSKFYINGAWVSPMGSETIEVINPSDESVIGSIAVSYTHLTLPTIYSV